MWRPPPRRPQESEGRIHVQGIIQALQEIWWVPVPRMPEEKVGGVCKIMIITVGGCAGSGTTTLCRKIAQHFNLTHVYAGKIFRDMASASGMSLQEFSEKAETDETIDLAVDQEQKRLAVDGSVVEGRITAYLVDADMKIWLTAPLPIRADRISRRETIPREEALEKITEREASEKKRYHAYYQIDIDDLTPYDLILNTALWDAEGVFHIVKNALEVRKW